jgi:hypothetical protein
LNSIKQKRRRPGIIPLAALALALAFVLTTPLAMSKYYAIATTTPVSASVAKWSPAFSINPASDNIIYRNSALVEGTESRTFSITNDSDVTADITIRVVASAEPGTPVSASSPSEEIAQNTLGALDRLLLTPATGVSLQGTNTWRFAPGATGNFTLQLHVTAQPSESTTIGWYREYKVCANAVQVN